jgi:hypothetical protein
MCRPSDGCNDESQEDGSYEETHDGPVLVCGYSGSWKRNLDFLRWTFCAFYASSLSTASQRLIRIVPSIVPINPYRVGRNPSGLSGSVWQRLIRIVPSIVPINPYRVGRNPSGLSGSVWQRRSCEQGPSDSANSRPRCRSLDNGSKTNKRKVLCDFKTSLGTNWVPQNDLRCTAPLSSPLLSILFYRPSSLPNKTVGVRCVSFTLYYTV